MRTVVGIDFGSANASIAVVAGHPTIIPDSRGYPRTPSVVAIAKHGRRLVGYLAKHQAEINAAHTIAGVKRLLGCSWSSAAAGQLRKRERYAIVAGPRGDARVRLRGSTYQPQEIGSFILRELHASAERYLELPVQQAMIGAPAHFDYRQREALVDAGRLADLEVIEVIDEPVAAAIANGVSPDDGRLVAVCDLGGGTFECAILAAEGGELRVRGHAHDLFVGGETIDAAIVEQLMSEFARAHRVDLAQDPMALQRLRDAAEAAKWALTTETETTIDLQLLTSLSGSHQLGLRRELSREELEQLAQPTIARCAEVCAHALEAAGVTQAAVEGLILCGGGAQMPAFRRAISDRFDRQPEGNAAPAEAVALGVATLAARVSPSTTEPALVSRSPAERRPDTEPAPPARPANERRRAGRPAVMLKIDYPTRDDFIEDYSVNISRGGMMLCTEQDLRIDEQLELEISFPGLLAPACVTAAVRWVGAQNDAGDRYVGVEFTRWDETHRAAFETLAERATHAPTHDHGRLRVLVADETSHLRRLVEQALDQHLGSDAGWEVEQRNDGQAILMSLDQRPYSALIVDVAARLLNGEALIRAVRQSPQHAAIPIVAIGGFGRSVKATALTAGADFALQEPLKLPELVSTLRLLLEDR